MLKFFAAIRYISTLENDALPLIGINKGCCQFALNSSVVSKMWYRYNGASAHFSRGALEYCNRTFLGNWIGYGGPASWPACSLDLMRLHVFLWGHVKTIMY
jgi:hypothetical protein